MRLYETKLLALDKLLDTYQKVSGSNNRQIEKHLNEYVQLKTDLYDLAENHLSIPKTEVQKTVSALIRKKHRKAAYEHTPFEKHTS